MKLKNQEVIEILTRLDNPSSLLNKQIDLPMELSWNLTKNYKTLDLASKDIQEFQKELQDKYIKEEKASLEEVNGQSLIKVNKEHIEPYNKKITELLEIEVELDIRMVDYSVLSQLSLSPLDCLCIEFMIKE